MTLKPIISRAWQMFPETSIKRLLRSYFYHKDDFLYKNNPSIFSEIYNNTAPLWNQEESKSGGGSTLMATTTIRAALPSIIKDFSITSMLDTPCGDYNWMKTVPRQCTYIGGDIVPELVEQNQRLYSNEKVTFKVIDITKDTLPRVDLIFCRECLQHLSDQKVKEALSNFKKSVAKYLLVTSFPKTWRNYDIHDGDYRPLNLHKKPFCLPKPLLKIKDQVTSKIGFDKSMYLYNLSQIETL